MSDKLYERHLVMSKWTGSLLLVSVWPLIPVWAAAIRNSTVSEASRSDFDPVTYSQLIKGLSYSRTFDNFWVLLPFETPRSSLSMLDRSNDAAIWFTSCKTRSLTEPHFDIFWSALNSCEICRVAPKPCNNDTRVSSSNALFKRLFDL